MQRTADSPVQSPETGPADPALEAELAAAIEPWLSHMQWRDDFASWRKRRIWQEDYQQDNLRDIIQAVGGPPTGLSVLDLGAGMGGLSVALLRDYGSQGLRLQALDYNPAYCEISRLRAQRYGLTLPIVVGAGEQLPYPARFFGLVVCMDVLEHVADPGEVLSEIWRVLKPGGIVLTTVPNRHAFRDPHYHLPVINWLPRSLAEAIVRRAGRSKSESALHDRQGLSDLNTYSWARFKQLASSKGFRVRDQVYYRIRRGEIRQLTGVRRALLGFLSASGLLGPVYHAYRYAWQGTYQILLQKPN